MAGRQRALENSHVLPQVTARLGCELSSAGLMGSHGEVETTVDTGRGTRARLLGRGGQGGRIDSKADPDQGGSRRNACPQRDPTEVLGQGHHICSEVIRDLGDQL